jgi:hypothetical protein
MFSHFLIFSSRVDPPHDVLLTVRCCHANGEDAADVMVFTLVITGGITVDRPACAGIASKYLGKVAPFDFSSNLTPIPTPLHTAPYNYPTYYFYPKNTKL